MLELINLWAGYGTLEILRGVSLHVDRHEIVTLLGPNGAGKTTIFRVIAGAIRPRAGRVVLGEHDLAGRPMWEIARQGIGYVPEGRDLFSSLTVRDNLLLAATYGGRGGRAGTSTLLESAFDLFPVLHARQNQRAGTLSGGQQQMLAIARAMMGEPRLLVLDEPTLGLAPQVVQQIYRSIDAIHRRGVGVLLIEQNARALQISDRVYVLERGRVVFSAPGADVARDSAVHALYLGSTLVSTATP